MDNDRVVCSVATALRNMALDARNKELIGQSLKLIAMNSVHSVFIIRRFYVAIKNCISSSKINVCRIRLL